CCTSTYVSATGITMPTSTCHQRPRRSEPCLLRWADSVGSARAPHATASVLTTATSRIPYWLTKWSTMSSTLSPLEVEKNARLTTAAGTVTSSVARTRVSSNLSRTAEITTSRMLTNDVRPASTSEPKNSTPSREPAGASLMIVGNTTNANRMQLATTSVTATSLACARKPRAANTPLPASSSKPEFERPTTSPEPVMSFLRPT